MNAVAGVATSERLNRAWRVVATVPDPELPALTLCDLGIIRTIEEKGDHLEVPLTPTYSGCPATEVIEASVRAALDLADLGPVVLRQQLAPAWTSEWISPVGRDKLTAYGIAPPGPLAAGSEQPLRFVKRGQRAGSHVEVVACTHCHSTDTERLAAFGSTACKALYRCRQCHEPFEYFKPI